MDGSGVTAATNILLPTEVEAPLITRLQLGRRNLGDAAVTFNWQTAPGVIEIPAFQNVDELLLFN